MESIDVKEKFIELRAQGYSFDKIAKELGKAKQTLVDWSRELQDEIANRKALELEALYEKFYLLKEHRLKTFGGTLLKLQKEIDSQKKRYERSSTKHQYL
jgi:IS30 family transposase